MISLKRKKYSLIVNLVLELSMHSIDHAILSILDKIQRAIDERDFSRGIFLDFGKAFDTIDHEILFKKKLKFYGIRGIAN